MLMVIFKWMNRDDLTKYVFIVSAGGTFPSLVFILTSLTFDRFLTVFYNAEYIVFWNKSRSKILLLLGYAIILVGLTTALMLIPTTDKAYLIFSRYILLPIDGVFGVVVVVTYSFTMNKVFHQYDLVGGTITHHVHIKKALLTAIMLVSTFILFIVIPDMIRFVYSITGTPPAFEVSFVLYICYRFGILITAFVYVYGCTSEVRTFIRNTIRRITTIRSRRNSDEADENSATATI